MKIHTSISLLALTLTSQAGTVGLWRFDEASAVAGSTISTAENLKSPGVLDAQVANGSPVYSADVPATQIFDPVSGQTYANAFSFDASGSEAQLLAPDSAVLNSSFTVEFFVKYVGEPVNYDPIFRRQEFADLGWQVDFDHAANLGYGRIRTRWDTPTGPPNGVAEDGIDENFNFVLGPQGNATAPKIFVDTGAKDALGADVGPQNTGNPLDYIYNAASANPSEVDVALQGDGINDNLEWHHVAMSFNQTTGEIKFYVDYLLAQTRTLSDSQADGYTHPAAGLLFGKLSASDYGLLLDEVRYSDAILTSGQFLREPVTGGGNTVAYWRMDEEGAVAGDPIITATNTTSALFSAGRAAGTPAYSADVPAASIFDPVSSTTYENKFSMDATLPNSRFAVPYDEAFDTSFTLEFFIKIDTEPGGFLSFFRRQQVSDLRWQVDFDHSANGAFGRMRCRFDTPAGLADGVNQTTDENNNFVVGPQGGANIPASQRIWIDTDAGDGLVSSYNDPVDWFLDGDSINDIPGWHHAAITFDEDTGVIGFYFDYELMQMRTLSDSQANGYTHPVGNIDFGKISSEGYALFLDEIRYSGEILLPFQFLQAAVAPDSVLEITELAYDPGTPQATITWNTIPGQKYSLDHSNDLFNWFEILEEEVAEGETMNYTDIDLLGGSPNLFYRVRKIE